MFSFLKFFNSKSNADKDKASDSLSGKTLNLNSPEARALNFFNSKSPIARKRNEYNTSFRSNCKESVTSPGFSFRIAQRAREMRSTTPNTDLSVLSTSYTLENSLNNSNTVNGINTTKDTNDKKRKLMETLDNFGVRKRTRQESGVDAFVNRRRRTINESTTPDRIPVINGYNHRLPQSASTVMNSKCNNGDNKKIKRNGDFGTNVCQAQKKPRTRNNEILSSYSSSKFLIKSGQKRPYQTDYEDKSPDRKHCKSCTCCGSTIVLEKDQNNLNKSDKTTETDISDELVTVAACRIFNRSGRTQVVKKMCMKSILDEVFDDVDPIPYTSIEKVEEKKKKAQKKVISIEPFIDKSNVKDSNQSVNSTAAISSTATSKFNEIQPTVTSISSTASSNGLVSSDVIAKTSLSFGVNSPDSSTKVNGEIKDNNTSPLSFVSSIVPVSSTETNHKQINDMDGKTDLNQPLESTNKSLEFQTSKTSEKNETNNKSQNDQDKPTFQLTIPGSTPCEPIKNTSTASSPKSSSGDKLPIIQFGNQNKETSSSLTFNNPVENSSKSSTFTFGASNADTKLPTPVLQFGSPKINDQQSTTVLKLSSPKIDDNQSTPVMQFGTSKDNVQQSSVLQFGVPKVSEKSSTPVMQFGAGKQSTPVMQFGSPKLDNQQSIPPLQFGVTKESTISTSSPLFSFGNNTKSNENSTKNEPVKFQFGSAKPDAASSLEPKSVVAFGSNTIQNQNLFNFGKTDPPKYNDTNEKSTPKMQFGALPTPLFGTSNTDQPKPSFSIPTSQSIDQGPKLMFGGQVSDNNPTTTTSSIIFANNTTNPVFQFNNSTTKLNEKTSETPSSTFAFSSTKAAPIFGASVPDKPTFQFNAQKTEEPKNQFSTPAFGSQSATAAPFKFGSNDKPTTFGSTFSSSSNQSLQQPLQFTNNTEKPAEPFKFGSTTSSNNTFQFSANKADNGPVKFGQASNTFSTAGFNGFGNSAPQQTTTFGSVPSPQPSPFGNMTSPSAAPTFGSVASPPSSTFGTNQGFQFGSTNNASSTTSTFAFGGNSQPAKPEGGFNFNAAPAATSPFQFGQTPTAMSTPQFGGTQSQGFGFGSPPMATNAIPGSSQPLFSMGTAPAGERRRAKAVRRRQ